MDLEFFIRAAKYFYFYHINEPLIRYYEAGGSLGSDPRALAAARELILEKYFDDLKKDRKSLSKHYYEIGSLLFSNGEIRRARNYLIKAARAYPLNTNILLLTFISFLGQGTCNKAIASYRKIRDLWSSCLLKKGCKKQ